MHTVNSRTIAAPASAVGGLLDLLGTPDDLLWPTTTWPPVRFDRPLGVGADGGHGPVRYIVVGYEPGHRIRFKFTRPFPVDGYHELTVEDAGEDQCRLTHVLAARTHGAMRLGWPIGWRWLHDALLEDLLDRAEAATTGNVRQPARWSVWVRLLRRLFPRRPRAAAVPGEATLLRAAFAGVRVEDADLVDAWRVAVPSGVTADPLAWADAMFRDPPQWVPALLWVRNALVGLVGINRSDESAFDALASGGSEVLLGKDDTHLDFRVSVLVSGGVVTVSTAARTHNRRGRRYLGVVRVAHPMVVRAMLARAQRRLAEETAARALQGFSCRS